jgi:hypothetical protein
MVSVWRVCCQSQLDAYHVDPRHHLRRHIIDVFQLGNRLADDFLHPLVISGTESGVPMVKNGKLGGDYTTGTALEALATRLNLCAQIEPPFGVGARSVQDSRDVILQNNGSEEANVDVSGELENVVVLPIWFKVSLSRSQTALLTSGDLPLLLFFVELVPVAVLAVLVDGVQRLGDTVVVAGEHQENCNHTGRHHHNSLRRNGIREYETMLECPHSLLLFLGVAV